jgi:anti-sigma factor ChrR (cupin superfamily)
MEEARMTTGITPHASNHKGLGKFASRYVHTDELPWEKTIYPGVETKTLFMDKPHGLMTVLLKMAPGATLPDHEHVQTEQTYMLEGRLLDKEGPEAGNGVGPGEFVWRPAGSRHAAWSPEGALMVAVFQIPNKFYQKDGKVVDVLGDDWEKKWSAALV